MVSWKGGWVLISEYHVGVTGLMMWVRFAGTVQDWYGQSGEHENSSEESQKELEQAHLQVEFDGKTPPHMHQPESVSFVGQ